MTGKLPARAAGICFSEECKRKLIKCEVYREHQGPIAIVRVDMVVRCEGVCDGGERFVSGTWK